MVQIRYTYLLKNLLFLYGENIQNSFFQLLKNMQYIITIYIVIALLNSTPEFLIPI